MVIAASHGLSALEKCLASLIPQGEAEDTEVIVVCNYNGGTPMEIVKEFPQFKIVTVAENTTVPELRTHGIFLSRGEIVALTEDHCFFDERWCLEIKQAHGLPYSVIGGSVENASLEKLLDWAVYLYEYGKYMLPNRAGVVDSLPGNNVSYKRCILERIEKSFRKGFFETFVHQELKNQGYLLYQVPSATVYHDKKYGIKKTLIQCYHHGRSFGGKRVSKAQSWRRLALAVGSLILPVYLSARTLLRPLRKRRFVRESCLTLPYLLLLMTSWSYGEFIGYVYGEGNSPTQWK